MIGETTTLGLRPSFGFGDRLGSATPGHVEALRRAGSGILPIFAQQSIREMTRTRRSPDDVMADAVRGARGAGYSGPMGSDADHLKTTDDVDRTADAGFVFFTIDPSEFVDGDAENYSPEELDRRFEALGDSVAWIDAYRGRTVLLPTGTEIVFTVEACRRAAVKYGRAVDHAISLAGHIERRMGALGREHEIELSVDETPSPTTLAEHYLIADRCRGSGMRLVSLAPRFVGELEKGVDYKGDLAAFERSLRDHAAVASALGPYKLSLHSGSDKLSIYPILARCTVGRFHVKTAGTSYLEALRVAARREPALFRRIVAFARDRYDADRATYHVSATLADAPPPTGVSADGDLEKSYLGLWSEVPRGAGFTTPGRQIVHCTFGSVLTDPELGPALRGVVARHSETYRDLLAEHFARHLEALGAGMDR